MFNESEVLIQFDTSPLPFTYQGVYFLSSTMAKGLRSKSKISNRQAKRSDPKSAFKVADDARMALITARLSQRKKLPKVAQKGQEEQDEGAEMEGEERDDATEAGDDGEGRFDSVIPFGRITLIPFSATQQWTQRPQSSQVHRVRVKGDTK